MKKKFHLFTIALLALTMFLSAPAKAGGGNHQGGNNQGGNSQGGNSQGGGYPSTSGLPINQGIIYLMVAGVVIGIVAVNKNNKRKAATSKA